MPDSSDKKQDARTEPTVKTHVPDEDHLEDQEKILAGRHDVNYPAMLTKDVQGG